MAFLAESDRQAIWSEWMSANEASISVTKADLRAVFDALDTFLENNAGAINNAIPQPARAALSAPQKAQILVYVIERRFKVGA